MAADFETVNGDVRIRVSGLSKTVRQLSKAGADTQDMKTLMHDLGMIVVNAANPPTDSGRLAATIRAGRGKTKAVVRAGGARAPYAPVVHYGWPDRNIAPREFLSDALSRERSTVLNALDAGTADILRKNDLK